MRRTGDDYASRAATDRAEPVESAFPPPREVWLLLGTVGVTALAMLTLVVSMSPAGATLMASVTWL